jgi:transposase InsO family protein
VLRTNCRLARACVSAGCETVSLTGRASDLALNEYRHPHAALSPAGPQGDEAPDHMVRDRDRCYGHTVTKRLAATGIRDHPIAPRSPWQNEQAERLIGSIRRECLDHIVVFGEAHLRRAARTAAARSPSTARPRARSCAPALSGLELEGDALDDDALGAGRADAVV